MKNKKYEITNAELEIMNVLWEKSPITLNEIVESLSKEEAKNKNTIKTLLYRLVEKESVISKTTLNQKRNLFEPAISQKQYQRRENENFLQKLYHGSTNKLLLNFVEEKKISKKDLQELLDLIED
ncbi:MAG: BlaI/MecI/CopY family transcriptional regulator [Clostridia bacterium]|nr:BlaI/MecI/CopY family transcriptional regulator [Clostridia bacterium]